MSLVREEIIRQKKCIPDKHDPTLQPYEAYKIDFDYFKILFAALSPWGKGETAESLAARIFMVSTKIEYSLPSNINENHFFFSLTCTTFYVNAYLFNSTIF